jgi:two-component system heavy metal sensor histidine kinase CusS
LTAPRRLGGSLSLRLGVMVAAVAVVVFSATVYLLHKDLERILQLDEEADLQAKIAVVRKFTDEVRGEADLPLLKKHLDAAGIGGRYRWSVWLVDRAGSVMYGDALPPVFDAGPDRIRIERQDGVTLRGISYALEGNPAFRDTRVYIGMDPRPRVIMLARYDRSSVIICGAGVLLTVALVFIATRRGLRPIRALSAEAASITPDAMSRRLTLPAVGSELMPMAQRFNQVLDGMEQAWQQLDGFSADVAHELRTPLAIMINGAEVALSRDRPAAELREALESHLEELRSLAGMVNDMLFLARADRGAVADNAKPCSLRREAGRVVDFVEAVAQEKRQAIDIEGDAEVVANAPLVCRAIVNLLTNAARHAAEAATITVRVAPTAHGARVEVVNAGAPIPDDVRKRMFDRFWRGDSARVKSGDRFGLGLAIVRAVATMHGGTTFAVSEGGCNRIGFTLVNQASAERA